MLVHIQKCMFYSKHALCSCVPCDLRMVVVSRTFLEVILGCHCLAKMTIFKLRTQGVAFDGFRVGGVCCSIDLILVVSCF